MRPRAFSPTVKAFAIVLTVGALGIAALLASLWIEHRTAISLPTPTGPFAVGRTIADWIDDASADPVAPVAGTRRELLVWIWYPAARGSSAAIAEYVPAPSRDAMDRVRGTPTLPQRLMT